VLRLPAIRLAFRSRVPDDDPAGDLETETLVEAGVRGIVLQITLKESGSGGRTRTYDTRIMIPLL
jgi:hypothetical protein